MQSQIIKGAVQSRYPFVAGFFFKVEVFFIYYILGVKNQFNIFGFQSHLVNGNIN